jgi:hypothetical protein
VPPLPKKQYEEWGVEPPTHEPHGTPEEIASAMAAQKVRHEWRQRGAVLFCIACPFEHATEPRFVDYLLQGTDSTGLPILKRV